MHLEEALIHTSGSLCLFFTLGDLIRMSNMSTKFERLLCSFQYLWRPYIHGFQKTHYQKMINAATIVAKIQRRRKTNGHLINLTIKERQKRRDICTERPKAVLLAFFYSVNANLRASIALHDCKRLAFSFPSGVCCDCCTITKPLIWDKKCQECFLMNDSEMSVCESNSRGITYKHRKHLPYRTVWHGFGRYKRYRRSDILCLI